VPGQPPATCAADVSAQNCGFKSTVSVAKYLHSVWQLGKDIPPSDKHHDKSVTTILLVFPANWFTLDRRNFLRDGVHELSAAAAQN
jgi:hypothetical protein